MAIQRPADARPIAGYAFRGFNGLIGYEVVYWQPGFVEARGAAVSCNANRLLHGGVLMTLLDPASGFACTFNESATARRLSVTLAFTTQVSGEGPRS
jgi:acyl-coenzyme A thioesterase PaaI-like protein